MDEEGKPKQKRRGAVVVNKDFCKGCGFCAAFCPKGVFNMSSTYSKRGYHFPVVENDMCVACFMCEMVCPDFAVKVEKL